MSALPAPNLAAGPGSDPFGGLAPYALLLGVNIGPLLTVVGSLATILTLTLLRQRGVDIGGWQYLRMGLLMMPPTLAAALLGLLLQAHWTGALGRHRNCRSPQTTRRYSV